MLFGISLSISEDGNGRGADFLLRSAHQVEEDLAPILTDVRADDLTEPLDRDQRSTCTTEAEMRAVTAREANQSFSELLSDVERGEEVLITKRGRPVAVLSPYQRPEFTPEREAAVARAIALMEKGLPWGSEVRPPTPDEDA